MEPTIRCEDRNAYQDNPRFIAAIEGTVNNKSMRIHSAAAPTPKITISGSIPLLKLGSKSRRSAIGCNH